MQKNTEFSCDLQPSTVAHC